VSYPTSGTFLKVEDPVFGAGVGDFTVRVAYKFTVTAAGINITATSIQDKLFYCGRGLLTL